MVNYLEILQKIEAQTLDNVKQIQAVQLSTLATAREIVAELPTAQGVPTFAQIAEVGTSFASQVLDQQKTFVGQLADLFTPTAKSSSVVKARSN
jgi:hypothetical protein